MHFGLSNPYCHSLYLQHPGKVLIRCGFGCDPNFRLPIRLPAYTLPAVELGATLREQDIAASVEFYFAEHFSAQLLGNAGEVEHWTNRASDYLSSFLFNRYIRRGGGGFKILRDRPIHTAEWEVLGLLADCLEEHASIEVRQFASNRGGRQAYLYMAAHAWYMQDPLVALCDLPSLTPYGARDWDTIIMVGGPAERVFYEARQTLMRHVPVHTDWNCMQVFSEIGARPTYHLTDGEFTVEAAEGLSLDQLLGNMAKQPKRDMLRLLTDCINYRGSDIPDLGNPKHRKGVEAGWGLLQATIATLPAMRREAEERDLDEGFMGRH